MYKLLTLLLAALILFPVFDADAQQRRATGYEALLQRTDQPSAYIDHVVLPDDENNSTFAVLFRLDYDFIPFIRLRPGMTPPTPDAEYFSTLRMGVEVFEGPAPTSRRASRSGTPVFRDSYQDTIWVESFEQTQSRSDYTQGFVITTLDEGEYHYEMQLARTESVREQSSSRRTFKVPDFKETKETNFILFSRHTLSGNAFEGTLLNYGTNVLYGQDYSVLIKIPANEEFADKKLTLNVNRLAPGSRDSDTGEVRHSVEISEENIIQIKNPSLSKNENDIFLSAAISEDGFRYALVEIPNQEFENARYRLRLMAEGREEPVGERSVNSQWLDMPVSLYNLDVSISMLRFILSDSELRRINSGSTSEKERKFREFWAERDPTPDTEFNELMAEYYNRIDHAHKNFTSLQTPGYDTDQGKAYIVYGPPLNVERRLPTNAPTREIWEYPNRTLIFEATTGFGDFVLISESS